MTAWLFSDLIHGYGDLKGDTMAYYTERHTMREPVKKTYDISVDVYTLIFQCCEKYYNNLAWKYPDQCPDGYGCCGLDLEKLNLDLKYEIPTLFRDDSGRIGIPSILPIYLAMM